MISVYIRCLGRRPRSNVFNLVRNKNRKENGDENGGKTTVDHGLQTRRTAVAAVEEEGGGGREDE